MVGKGRGGFLFGATATVELSPHMGGPAFDAIEAWLAGATDIPKLVTINGDLFTQDTAAEEYRRRTQQ
jgi:simple sugar transport system substrate-binding protein